MLRTSFSVAGGLLALHEGGVLVVALLHTAGLLGVDGDLAVRLLEQEEGGGLGQGDGAGSRQPHLPLLESRGHGCACGALGAHRLVPFCFCVVGC